MLAGTSCDVHHEPEKRRPAVQPPVVHTARMPDHADLMGASLAEDLLAPSEFAPLRPPARQTRGELVNPHAQMEARTPAKVLVLPPDPTQMVEKGRKLYLQNQIRQAFHHLAANNLDAVQSWLHKVSEDSPAKAIELFIELAKFSLPQLKETAVTVTQNGSQRTFRSSEEILQELNSQG